MIYLLSYYIIGVIVSLYFTYYYRYSKSTKFLDEQLVKIRKDRQKTFHVFTTASILSAIPNTKLNLQKYELINNYSDGKSFKIEVKFK